MRYAPLELSVVVNPEVEPLLNESGINLPHFEEQMRRALVLAEPHALIQLPSTPNESLECHFLLTNDAHIAQMNAHYRGIPKPTDVLTFGYDEGTPIVGDVAISVETAQRQAHLNQHDLMTELLILGLHGWLHLLGYNDETDAERNQMVQRSVEILRQMGYPANSAWYSRYDEIEP